MARSKKQSVQSCPTEEAESIALASWARMMVETNQEPRLKLLRCGFEGLRLPMGLRMKVKRQSVSKAWPDWWLSTPKIVKSHDLFIDGQWQFTLKDGFYGLYIELKRLRGGVVSAEQEEMHALLRKQGYRVEVCKGCDAAIKVISEYLGLQGRD